MTVSTLSGSCLCGACRYTVTGEEQRFFHCHCSRCRKASGTGHASNLFVQGSLEWQSGAERVKTFKLPGAKRFSNTFCSECGGRLPRFVEEFNVVFVPAGSLDTEPTIRPQARIFSASRSAWSCDDTAMTVFEAYPG